MISVNSLVDFLPKVVNVHLIIVVEIFAEKLINVILFYSYNCI